MKAEVLCFQISRSIMFMHNVARNHWLWRDTTTLYISKSEDLSIVLLNYYYYNTTLQIDLYTCYYKTIRGPIVFVVSIVGSQEYYR